jgi:chromatin segregation and condensation protein Rec8/ScpA/Scc1 (kleisin family)
LEAEEILREFQRTKDIAKAGLRILELVRRLKEDIISYLRGERKSKERKKRAVKLIGAKIILINRIRAPGRYPTVEEFLEAVKWAQSLGKVEALRIADISMFDLAEHVERVRSIIRRLRDEGRSYVSLKDISPIAGGIIAVLALLFLEKEGEVVLIQERPFGEIKVVIGVELLGEGEEVA